MELFLNLAWLLLAVPAFWLWRDSRTALTRRKIGSLQCLLAINCMLVMLFPVVSATDDLRAMQAEMEEPPATKRSVYQTSSEKPSVSKWEFHPGLAPLPVLLCLTDPGWVDLPVVSPSFSSSPALHRAGRAPPRPALA
jgi:hypothetical protein